MPIKVPDKLPATKQLRAENIFVMSETKAMHQDIRSLKIAIVNLMPTKITTETQLLRLLGNSPLQVEFDFVTMKSHESKNTPPEHLKTFYRSFDDIKSLKYDGMIITGAPVENLDFADVDYWDELREIMEWSKTHVTSTLHICWAAQAGLYYHYGIPKYALDCKKFGVFRQRPQDALLPIFRGFDDEFFMPQSRHTEVRKEDILACDKLTLIADSDESGVGIVMARNGREFFVTGHLEYSPLTLDKEYRRDFGKRDDVKIPENYYLENNPDNPPIVRWRAHANLFFSNWINYYVYQETPYDISKIG